MRPCFVTWDVLGALCRALLEHRKVCWAAPASMEGMETPMSSGEGLE